MQSVVKMKHNKISLYINNNKIISFLFSLFIIFLFCLVDSVFSVVGESRREQFFLKTLLNIRLNVNRLPDLAGDVVSGRPGAIAEFNRNINSIDKSWALLGSGSYGFDKNEKIDSIIRILVDDSLAITEDQNNTEFLKSVAGLLKDIPLAKLKAEYFPLDELNSVYGFNLIKIIELHNILYKRIIDESVVIADGVDIMSQIVDQYVVDNIEFKRSVLGLNDLIKKNKGRHYFYDDLVNYSNLVNEIFFPAGKELTMEIFDARKSIVDYRSSSISAANSLNDMIDSLSSDNSNIFSGAYSVVFFGGSLFLTLLLMPLPVWFKTTENLRIAQDENNRQQESVLKLLDELGELADGDLTVSATVTEEITGAIADSVNYTVEQLRRLVSRINATSLKVSRSAQNILKVSGYLAKASSQQAREITDVSAEISDMAITIDNVSENAAESARVANRSVSIAGNGSRVVQKVISGMGVIREQIQDTSKRIKRLGESSQEIGDIVSLINDIADQTNILALNAAIQASMAGEAGHGFAVVADEVQRLAERSAAATKQIGTIVNTIQADTKAAVSSMEQTTAGVVEGARLALDAGVALEEIEAVSTNLSALIQNISSAANQQSSSAIHISNNMNIIKEITSKNSMGTHAASKLIASLAKMALELRESVSGFTLPEDFMPVEHDDPNASLSLSSVLQASALAVN